MDQETVDFTNVGTPPAPTFLASVPLNQLRDSLEAVVDPSSSEVADPALLGAGPPGLLASLDRALSGDSSGSSAGVSDQGGGIIRGGVLPADTGTNGFTADTILGRLLDSGQGAFSLADIGSTIATLADLRDRLDALDNIPGNVTFTQANGVTRFDVQVHKTLSGTADLDLNGLGGSLNIAGSIDVSADLALHLVFGVDSHGFFIDPRGTADPFLTVSNLQIDGNIQGTGQLGFLDVTMSGATLTVDPAVQITVQLQPPANSPDGLIRLDELTTQSPSLFSATITGNPNGSDVVLTGNFSVDAVLPGGTSLLPDLANAQVTFTWPHVDHPTDVRVTASAGAGQTLVDFLNSSSAQVADGLSTLAGVLQPTTGFDLFGQPIPLLNKSLGQILGGAQNVTVNNTAVANVSAVYPAGGFNKFDVVLSGLNLQMMNVAAGDSVTYNMANGDAPANGTVDAVDAGTITIRFDSSLTQPPDPQNLSLVVHTAGSLQHQLNSFLSTLANPVQLSAQVPTLQSLARKLSDILGIDVSQIGLNVTDQVAEIIPDFSLQPITFTQSLDFSTAHIPGLNLSSTGSTFTFSETPHLRIPFGIRLDPSLAADKRFFLEPDSSNPLFSLQVDATFDPNVTGTIGFLNVALQDGSPLAAAPNNHGISIHGNVSVFLKDPGSDSDPLITLDELQNVLQHPSTLGNLFDPHIGVDLFASLQIKANVGNASDVTDTLGALTIGLHDPSGTTTPVHITGLGDLQNLPNDLDGSADSSNFDNFANLTPSLIVQGFLGLFTQLGLLGNGSAFSHVLGILPINLKDVLHLDRIVSGALNNGGPQVSDVLDAQHLLGFLQNYLPAGAVTLTVNPSDLRVHFHIATDFTTQPASFSLGLGGSLGHLVSASVTGIPPLHLHAQADLTVGIKTDANTPLFDRFFLDTSSTTSPSGAVTHATDIQVAALFDAGYDLTADGFTPTIGGSPLSFGANVGPISITANGSKVLVRVGLDVHPDNATHEVTLSDLPSIFTSQSLPQLTGCRADPQSPGRDVPIPDPNAPADIQAYVPVQAPRGPVTIVVLGRLADITNLQAFLDDPQHPIPITLPPTTPADLSNMPGFSIYVQNVGNFNLLSGIDPNNVDITTLLNGLGSLTAVLANALNGPLGQISFPLIGRLHNGAAFVTDLNNTIQTALMVLNSQPDHSDQAVMNALLSAFNPAPTANNPNPPRLIPSGAIHVEHDSEHAQFDFGIHQVYRLASVSLAADFGIPGLHLTVSPTSTLTVSLVIDFAFGIGYSKEDGFYFDTNAYNHVTAGLYGVTPLTHNLAIGLSVAITSNDPAHPTDGQIATGQLASLLNVSLSKDPNGDFFDAQGGFTIDVHGPSESTDPTTHRLTLSELGDLADLVNADFAGWINADVHLKVDFGSGAFPSFSTNLKVGWQFGGGDLSGGVPSVAFDDVKLDLGTFFSQFVGPILADVQAVLKPFAPVIHFINSRLPVISDLRGQDITLLKLAEEAGQVDPEAQIAVDIVQKLVDSPPIIPSENGVQISLGSFSLGGVDLRTGDESTASINPSTDATEANVDSQLATNAPGSEDFLNSADDNAPLDDVSRGLQFPLLKNPTSAFKLLLGRPVDLVTFTLPDADLPLVHENELFQIFGPFFVRLIGDVSLHTNLTVGYDTRGLSEFLNSHHAADLLDGFFVKDDAYAQVQATIEANLEVNVEVASAGIGGGINGVFSLGLHDPRSANQDHKIYFSQIVQDLSNDVFCIFDLHGSITAYLHAYVRVGFDTPFGFAGWSHTFDIAKTTFDFDLHCNSTSQAPPPVLGHVDNGVLTLFMGPKAGMRQNVNIPNVGNFNQDGDETFIVSRNPNSPTDPNNQTVDVTFLVIDQNGIPHSFKQTNIPGVREIYAEGGTGNNSITIKPDVTAQAVLFGHFDPNDSSLTPDQRSYTGGDDTVVAGGGNTTIYGGGANDLLTAGPTGNGEIHGGQNSTIHGGGGPDLLYGGTGHNEIYGGTGHNEIHGGTSGDNVLQAGTGDDVLYGGPMANNTYVIDNSRVAAGSPPLLTSSASGIVIQGSGTSNVLHLVNGAGTGFTETYTPGSTPDAGTLITGNGIISQRVAFSGFTFTVGASQISAAIVDEVPVDQFTYDDHAYTGGLQIVNADVGTQNAGGQSLSTATQTLIAPVGTTPLSTTVPPFSFDHKGAVTVRGGTSIAVDNPTSADGMTSLTIDAGQAGAVVDVLSTSAGCNTTVTQSQQGLDEIVTVGRRGNLADIQGPLTVSNVSRLTTLNVVDSTDTTAKLAYLSDTAVTGLAPAAINFTASSLRALNVAGGSGGNLFTVLATGAGYTTTLVSGKGTDNVVVGDPLSTGGSIVDLIRGPLVIKDSDGKDGLTVDDSASQTNKTGTLTDTMLSGLGMGGTITYPQCLGVNLFLGLGPDTLNVQSTSTSTTILGKGPNTIRVGVEGSLSGIIGDLTVQDSGRFTTLYVDDSSDHANKKPTLSVLKPKGTDPNSVFGEIKDLAPALIHFQTIGMQAVYVTGGTGVNSFSVKGTGAGFTTTLNPGQHTTGSPNIVTVTNNGSVQGILGILDIRDVTPAVLTVDDSADSTGRNATISDSSITGLAPAAIDFLAAALQALSVGGGSGGNTFGVTATGAGYTTTLNPGNHATAGHGPGDKVNVGNAGSAQGILGTLSIQNQTALTTLSVDDSADTTGRSPVISNGSVTGLAPAKILFDPLGLQALNASGGTGGNTWSVLTTGAGYTTALTAGPTDTVSLATATLDSLPGAVSVTGRSGGTAVTLNDASGPMSNTLTLTRSTLKRPAFGGLTYASIGSLTINAAADPNAFTDGNKLNPQTIYVLSTAAGVNTTINAAVGFHNIIVGLSNPNPLGIPGMPLDGILGAVTVSGQGYQDNLDLYDSVSTSQKTYTMSATSISTSAVNGVTPASISWQGYLSTVVLFGSTAADTYQLQSLQTDLAAMEAVGAWTANTVQSLVPDSLTWVIYSNEVAQTGKPGYPVIFREAYNLTGGPGHDDFQFRPSDAGPGGLNGVLNGGGGGTLDYSLDPSPVTVNLTVNLAKNSATNINGGAAGGFSNIQNVIGNGASTTLVGPDQTDYWNIVGANKGNLLAQAPNQPGPFTFSQVPNLIGGAGNDDFQFGPGATVSGLFDGGGGINTLDYSQYAVGVTVNLTGQNTPDSPMPSAA
jgi:hypothetical protein